MGSTALFDRTFLCKSVTSERRISQRLMFVVAAAFMLRMALIVAFKTYAHPVGWEYEVIANHLLAGKGYSLTFLHTTYWSFNTPLFGYLCAGVYAVTKHSYLAILIIQSLFSIALTLTIFQIGKIVFSETVGLLAAALVVFHPGFMYYDVFNLLPFSIDSFLIAAVILLLLKHKNRPTPMAMSLVGVLIGIAVLSRGITGALLPVAIIYVALFARSLSLKERLITTLCLLTAALIVLAPWITRNYLIHKQFVFISSTIGENFWRGNNMYATGTSSDANRIPILDMWPIDFKEKVYAMTEMQQKKFFESEAWHFITANPAAAAKLYLKKVYYFWWFSPQSGIIYPKAYLTAYKYLYIILISFSLVGIGFALASPKREVVESSLILISVPISICLAQSVFYVEGRHRWLIEPIVIIFFSYGVTNLWKALMAKRGT
jgi:4-amino-4-deoxy-L-arabinose transferase-like glycosyltransferase